MTVPVPASPSTKVSSRAGQHTLPAGGPGAFAETLSAALHPGIRPSEPRQRVTGDRDGRDEAGPDGDRTVGEGREGDAATTTAATLSATTAQPAPETAGTTKQGDGPAHIAGDAKVPGPAADDRTVPAQPGDTAGGPLTTAAGSDPGPNDVNGATPPDQARPATATVATQPLDVSSAAQRTTGDDSVVPVPVASVAPTADPSARDTAAEPLQAAADATDGAGPAADATQVATDTPVAAAAPVPPARVAPTGAEASMVVEAGAPAANAAAPVSHAGDIGGTAPGAAPHTPAVTRVIQLVERLRTEPPPQHLVVDLEQFGVGRLVISLRGDTVLVGPADGATRSDPQWWRELGEALDQRGWSLDGRREQSARDRHRPSQSYQGEGEPQRAGGWGPEGEGERAQGTSVSQLRHQVDRDRGLRL
ncbi:MAG TPA: hypothetical protein VK891_16345 [Euzebyales bacterium]|nr:hypothetical protein [Euzebyales bacterium]